jgi:hypothetical protein
MVKGKGSKPYTLHLRPDTLKDEKDKNYVSKKPN